MLSPLKYMFLYFNLYKKRSQLFSFHYKLNSSSFFSIDVYTIEGNTGDPGLVRKRERDITSDEIIAYGSWYK
jgi:hypothetical protein